jgi:hypothetical protein
MYPDDDSLFDTDAQIELLRMIAIRCTPRQRPIDIAATAARTLQVDSGAARQLQLDRIIPLAIADAGAEWTRAERYRLIHGMGTPGDDGSRTAPAIQSSAVEQLRFEV